MAASSGSAARRSPSSIPGKSSTPECTRKHLNPSTPAAKSGLSSAALPGTTPPQKPTSTASFPAAAASFSPNAATLVVAGMLLSGMSTIVVTPPAAAARVAVANPSHSVRPGSLHVHVRVDESGHQHQVTEVDHLGASRHFVVRRHRNDRLAFDVHRRRRGGPIDDYAEAAKDSSRCGLGHAVVRERAQPPCERRKSTSSSWATCRR